MITLQQLINVAPFPEETRKELHEGSENFSDSKKIELEKLCWAFISQWYQNELRAKQETATLEMAKGEKVYTSEDFAKMEKDLFQEIINKFKAVGSNEDLEEVRTKLATLN